jgi:hypothetical protein
MAESLGKRKHLFATLDVPVGHEDGGSGHVVPDRVGDAAVVQQGQGGLVG